MATWTYETLTGCCGAAPAAPPASPPVVPPVVVDDVSAGWGDAAWGSSSWGYGTDASSGLAAPAPAPRFVPSSLEAELLGVDVDVVTDASPDFRLARGRRNLANALARRLSTPRGGLWYAPDYGLDLREYLHAGVTTRELGGLPAAVTLEVLKDPRVQAAAVDVKYSPGHQSLVVNLTITTAAGPFKLILSVDQVTVALLNAGE
jgi:hypothetical protein